MEILSAVGPEVTLVAAVLVGLALTTVAIFRDLVVRRRVISPSHHGHGGVT